MLNNEYDTCPNYKDMQTLLRSDQIYIAYVSGDFKHKQKNCNQKNYVENKF